MRRSAFEGDTTLREKPQLVNSHNRKSSVLEDKKKKKGGGISKKRAEEGPSVPGYRIQGPIPRSGMQLGGVTA